MSKYSHGIAERIQSIVSQNKGRITTEIRETKEMYELMTRWGKGEELTRAEKSAVKRQLLDICKTIPALAVFVAPFGILILGILMRVLPFNILPSAFEELEEDLSNVRIPKPRRSKSRFWHQRKKPG